MAVASPEAAGKKTRIFYGWYIVAASILTNALVTAAYFQGFQAFVLPILNEFGWTRTQLAGATSTRQVESGIVGPAVGLLADRVGPRKLIIIGGVIVGLSVIGLSQTRSLPMYYFFFIMISVGTGGATHGVTWPLIISRWFRKRRGRAIGIAMSGPVLGGVMVIPNTFFVEQWGWRSVLFAYGVVILVVVPLMGFIARNRPEPYGYAPDGDPPEAFHSSLTPAGEIARPGVIEETGLSVSGILRSRAFWAFALFLGGLGMASSAFGQWQVAYFVDRGMTNSEAALVVAATVVASGFGRVVGGAFLDFISYRVVLVGVALVMAFSQFYLVLVEAGTFVLAIPFSATFGFATGSMVALRPAVGGMLFGTRNLGAVIGLLQGGALASGVAGPIIMGNVFDRTDSYQGAIWFFALFTLLMLLMIIPMEPAKRQPAAR